MSTDSCTGITSLSIFCVCHLVLKSDRYLLSFSSSVPPVEPLTRLKLLTSISLWQALNFFITTSNKKKEVVLSM